MVEVTFGDVEEAIGRLEGVAHRTPVLTSRTLDGLVGGIVLLKAENLQRGGAFKFRGAYNKINSLPADQRARGVVAYSSGNHAQAVALAARLHEVPAVIVMPTDAPASKVEATRGYGAEVVTYDRYTEDRVAVGERLAGERGGTLVPPYDDPKIIAGQGTVGVELIEDAGPLDLLVAPVGGGGLISGCSTAAAALSPRARIVGVEPEAGDDTRRSLEAGHRVGIEVPRTIADGLQGDIPGRLTFPIVQRLVERIVTVTDAQIVDAMVFLHERLKVVVEPSGAAGVAALLSGALKCEPQSRIGVILSGGNVGANRFAELIANSGRTVALSAPQTPKVGKVTR
ncbi:MAG: threo-3-hydroxy-L-aspartate ammonia-lyase [Actinobacteria bacterium]|nr:threo-3-hydroxy-L-aspartate ammonia-lyase [Actinomycetota bacterium]